jgi:hypothetical protein
MCDKYNFEWAHPPTLCLLAFPLQTNCCTYDIGT